MTSINANRDTAGHAVVIGASMAGLLAARVLSEYFERVSVVERDRLPSGAEHRKGVPQARHAHALLAGGRGVMEDLFPGMSDALIAEGATSRDVAAFARWSQPGGYRARFTSGIRGLSVSRPLLEEHVRRGVRNLPNVSFIEGRSVAGLLADGERVSGVEFRENGTSEPLGADLVVDAAGRGSRAPRWIENLGYGHPPVEEIKVGIGYTTKIFRRVPEALPGATFSIIQPVPPNLMRYGALLPLEGNRWMVTLGGYLGDHCPTDDEGFLAFAKTLAAPDIHDAIKNAERLGETTEYKFPANIRRRYEKLPRFPDGYLVTGDALCAFNPIYGQGMSVAALEAAALAECLEDGLEDLPRRFHRKAAKVIDTPWRLAAGADLAFPEVEGERTRVGKVVGRYVAGVMRAATHDEKVCLALIKVTNLLEPPSTLFRPSIALRVLRDSLARRGGTTAAPSPEAPAPEAA